MRDQTVTEATVECKVTCCVFSLSLALCSSLKYIKFLTFYDRDMTGDHKQSRTGQWQDMLFSMSAYR